MLLQLLGGNRREPLEQLRRRDLGVLALAAGGEQEGEQRLEDGEPLRRDRPGGPLDRAVAAAKRRLARGLGRRALVGVPHAAERGRDLAAKLVRLQRHRAAVLP